MNIDALTSVRSLQAEVAEHRARRRRRRARRVRRPAAIAAGGALVGRQRRRHGRASWCCARLALVWAVAGVDRHASPALPGRPRSCWRSPPLGDRWRCRGASTPTTTCTAPARLLADLGQRLAVTVSCARLPPAARRCPTVGSTRPGIARSSSIGYVTAVVVGLVLLADRDNVLVWPVVVLWVVVADRVCRWRTPATCAAGAVDRRRMQWIGWALAVAAEVAVVARRCVARHRLAAPRRRDRARRHRAGAAARSPPAPCRGCRAASTACSPTRSSLAGLTALIVVCVPASSSLGLGRTPNGSERTLLLLSMWRPRVAALAYLPARSLADRARQPPRLRRARRARRGAAHVGQPPHPRDPARRAAAAAGRVAAQVDELRSAPRSGPAPTATTSSPPCVPAPPARRRTRSATEGATGGQPGPACPGARGSTSGCPGSSHRRATRVDAGRADRPRRRAARPHRRATGRPTASRSPRTTTGCSPSSPARSAWRSTTCSSTPRCRRRSTSCATANDELQRLAGPHRRRRRRRAAQARAQPARRRPAAPRGAGGEAAPRQGRRRRTTRPTPRRCSTSSAATCRTRSRSCAPWPTASSRRCLMSGGLAEALPAAAGRAALPTTRRGRRRRPLPAEVEAAVYFCCLEALQNAGKHAGDDASAIVKVWERRPRCCASRSPTTAPASTRLDAPDRGHGFVNMTRPPGRHRRHASRSSAHPVPAPPIRGHVPLTADAQRRPRSRASIGPRSQPAAARPGRRRLPRAAAARVGDSSSLLT